MAWLGGGIFVVSLAYFLRAFYTQWGVEPPGGPLAVPIVIDVGLFSLFALHHSLLARTHAKAWVVRLVPAHLERTFYVWVASLLFIAVCTWWTPIPGVLYRHSGPWALPHWLAVAAGAWLTAQSTAVVGALELAGIRQAGAHAAPPQFRVVGPYHWVRHPIYLGWILLVFGVPHMTATRLAFAVISSAYLVVAIPFEERTLVETFGDEYRMYQRDVRWRLVPGVW